MRDLIDSHSSNCVRAVTSRVEYAALLKLDIPNINPPMMKCGCHKPRGIRGPIETPEIPNASSANLNSCHKPRGIRGPIETTEIRRNLRPIPSRCHKPRGIRGPIETFLISNNDKQFISLVTSRVEYAALLKPPLGRTILTGTIVEVTSRVEYAALLKPGSAARDRNGHRGRVTSRVEYAALLKLPQLLSHFVRNTPLSQAAWNTRPY